MHIIDKVQHPPNSEGVPKNKSLHNSLLKALKEKSKNSRRLSNLLTNTNRLLFYNFNNSIVAVSSVNNSAFKKSKINKYINYFTKTEKGRVFFKQKYFFL